jgi:hypothetical protein
MPTYTFREKLTHVTRDVFMNMSELDQFILDNPDLEQVPTAPAIVSGVDGLLRPDDGFRDLLKEMKKKHKKGDLGKFT